MNQKYDPPRQSGLGQFIDSAFLMALVYIALLMPILLGLTGGETKSVLPEGVVRTEAADGTVAWEGLSWEALDQNPTMQAQWEKLGYDLESAAELITTRFDYEIKPFALLITAAVIIGYFVFLVIMSEKEYREVIAERFGDRR
jgi:Ca2+/H+ antiporter